MMAHKTQTPNDFKLFYFCCYGTYFNKSTFLFTLIFHFLFVGQGYASVNSYYWRAFGG